MDVYVVFGGVFDTDKDIDDQRPLISEKTYLQHLIMLKNAKFFLAYLFTPMLITPILSLGAKSANITL